ncbi:MAG: hypothetical protein SPL08_01880 [Pseudomonadota bacterium]|nr:hypothetical protein [Pseudomonadota bacterium]
MADDQYRNISSDEMAKYLEQSFQNPDVAQFLNTSDDILTMTNRFRTVGRYISVYATSTGDLSQRSVSKIVSDLQRHTTLEHDKRAYLKEIIGPMILRQQCQKLGLSYPVSIEDTPKLLDSIRMQSKNNCFETHSFNGALIDEVKANGLDIHKEKFQEEFKELDRVGMRQPFQQGKLLFCELSYGTFGYALRAPEKLIMAFNHVSGKKQEKTQSNRDYCLECMEDYISQKGISGSDAESIRKASRPIIDFYFRPKGNKSAIAIRKGASLSHRPNFEEKMWQIFTYYMLKSDVSRFCKKNNDAQSLQSFEEAVKEFNQSKKHDKLSIFVQEFTEKYPQDNPIQKAHQEFLYSTLRAFCLNNYEYANCDGYAIPGGRLSPKEFSLAVMDNPIDNYVEYQKQQAKPPQQKYGILFGRDGKNYMVPLDKGGKLIIPDSLKEKYPDSIPSNTDILRGAANGGQVGEPPMDKHNAIDYRNVAGKDRKPEIPIPNRPLQSQEDDAVRKRAEEIRRQLGWDNQLAAKHGHSL